jgi:glycosyltransferase involved in cell wall biosynthesis
MSKLSASIILPAYNEEKCIDEVLDEIIDAMKPYDETYDYEIIVVDDCSTDKTPEIVKAKGDKVIYLRNEKNMGAGASRKVGIKYSEKDVVVFMDADKTYTAADIPRMLRHFPESDHVNGYRDKEMGYFRPLRKFVKALSRYLASFLVWEYIADLNTGLKAFKREKMLPYLDIVPPGFSCVTTMTLIAYCCGHKFSYITTEYHLRVGQSKFHPIKDTALLFCAIFKTVGLLNPIRLILFIITTISVPVVFRYSESVFSAFTLTSIICGIYIIIMMYTARDCMRFE